MTNHSIRQIQAMATLELTRVMRSRSTVAALVAFTALLALGHWLHWQATPPRPVDDRLFSYAFLAAVMIGLRFGIASDRRAGAEHLLAGNLIEPTAFFYGKVVALVIGLLAFTAYTIVVGTLLSGGDGNYALWYALHITLVVALFLPLILLAEFVMDTRYPAPAIFVIFAVTVTIAGTTVGIQALVDFMGITSQRLDYRSLAPLAWRAPVSIAITSLLYPLWYARMSGRITLKQLY